MPIQNFFDKTRGKNIDIQDFPFLFSLQAHTGMSGIGFSAVWFGIVRYFYPEFWNLYTSVIAGVIVFGFGLMVVLSTIFSQKIFDRSFDENRSAEGWDLYARIRMTALIVLFAVVCSTLIWVTGGMSSPFTPFYIMVYTLTLTRCALPHPGRELLILYGITFGVAGLLGQKLLPPHVSAAVVAAIAQGKEREFTEFGFALAAMIVPYLSTLIAESREARRRRHATRPLPTGGGNPQSPGPSRGPPEAGGANPQPPSAGGNPLDSGV